MGRGGFEPPKSEDGEFTARWINHFPTYPKNGSRRNRTSVGLLQTAH